MATATSHHRAAPVERMPSNQSKIAIASGNTTTRSARLVRVVNIDCTLKFSFDAFELCESETVSNKHYRD